MNKLENGVANGGDGHIAIALSNLTPDPNSPNNATANSSLSFSDLMAIEDLEFKIFDVTVDYGGGHIYKYQFHANIVYTDYEVSNIILVSDLVSFAQLETYGLYTINYAMGYDYVTYTREDISSIS